MSDCKLNKWLNGPTFFNIPSLDEYMGMRDGLLPIPFTLDKAVGLEVVLVVRDQTPFMEELRQVKPFRLLMKMGGAHNVFGPLAFILFWVENPADLSQPFAAWEYYLNPKSEKQMGLWRNLAAQSHWHLLLVGTEGQQREFFEFENNYGLGEALDSLEEMYRNLGTIDFRRATQRFASENTVEDLFRMQSPHKPRGA